MTTEKSLFTVSEDEKFDEEIIVVAEEEMSLNNDLEQLVNDVRMPAPKVEVKEQESDDWRVSKKPKHFMQYLNNTMNKMPHPNNLGGNRTALERALGQYKKLDSDISKALHSDCDDEIDIKHVDGARHKLEQAIDQAETALENIIDLKNKKRKMRRHGEEENDMVKEATAPRFEGIQINVTAFERAIVGALINGVVSGGRNMEELYEVAKKKYDFSEREELAIYQILSDFGYPVFKDRLTIGQKDTDPTRTKEHGEWASNYYA